MKIKVYFTDNGFVVVKDQFSEAYQDKDMAIVTETMQKAVGKAIVTDDLETGGYGFELEIKVKPIDKDIFQ